MSAAGPGAVTGTHHHPHRLELAAVAATVVLLLVAGALLLADRGERAGPAPAPTAAAAPPAWSGVPVLAGFAADVEPVLAASAGVPALLERTAAGLRAETIGFPAAQRALDRAARRRATALGRATVLLAPDAATAAVRARLLRALQAGLAEQLALTEVLEHYGTEEVAAADAAWQRVQAAHASAERARAAFALAYRDLRRAAGLPVPALVSP
jgi:hypothetical protein